MKNILNKLITYFSPVHPVTDPENSRKNDLTILVCINIAIFGLLMFVTRYLIEGSSASITIWLLPLSTSLIVLSLLAIKYFNKSNIPTYNMLTLGILVISLRSASTGGIYSPVAVWLTLVPAVAILLLPLRHSFLWMGITILTLVPLTFPEFLGFTITQKKSSVTIQFIVVAIFILVVSFLVFFYERERIRNEKKIQESEKKLASGKRLIALGNISGGLAHEINNPLAIIKGHVDLLKLKMAKDKLHDPYLSFAIEEMRNNITRIQGIVDSMRTFTNDDFFMATGKVQLRPVIEEAFHQKSGKLGQFNIEYSITTNSDAVVSGNRESILRILLNLIENSIDELKEKPSGWIRVNVEEKEKTVLMTFADSGKGIKQDIEEQIMEPFFTTKPVGSGIGLGLTICYNLMKNQGGSITYDSHAENTTFRLIFINAKIRD